jgi:hypothetical protein
LLFAQGKSEASASDAKVLRVAMEGGYAPYNWTQTTNANEAVPISGSKEFAYGYDVVTLNSKRVDFICTDMSTAKVAIIAYPTMKILHFAGSNDDFKVREEEIDIGNPVYRFDHLQASGLSGLGFEQPQRSFIIHRPAAQIALDFITIEFS